MESETADRREVWDAAEPRSVEPVCSGQQAGRGVEQACRGSSTDFGVSQLLEAEEKLMVERRAVGRGGGGAGRAGG